MHAEPAEAGSIRDPARRRILPGKLDRRVRFPGVEQEAGRNCRRARGN